MKPEYTLHPTKEGFIVTSNEQFKIGDINVPSDVISINEFSNTSFEDLEVVNNKNNGYKKVIAQQDQLDLSPVPEERQREIGYFDVDSLIKEHMGVPPYLQISSMGEMMESQFESLKSLFQKAIELTSNRRFTFENVLDAWELGAKEGLPLTRKKKEDLIQSLSNQSWPAELEMEVCVFGQHSYYDSNIEDYVRPKFTDGKVKILKIN